MRCPDPEYAQKMIDAIDAVRVRGDSVGGIVTCIARNVPRVRVSTISIFNLFVNPVIWVIRVLIFSSYYLHSFSDLSYFNYNLSKYGITPQLHCKLNK